MRKKPDIMGLVKQDEKIIELLYTESSHIICSTTMYLNILVKDLAGIPRYFHLDHMEIPLSPYQSRLKSLICLLLTLRNVMIINRSLIMLALEQATFHPPRNINPSSTVFTPPYNKYNINRYYKNGLEKQLGEREALLRQKENNIKKTIKAQVYKEHKCLKDEYNALKDHLEGEYNKCMIDMKQTTYSFKHQLENQQKSSLDNLEKQYKSHISTLEKSIAVKDKEIDKLSATISQLKNYKNALKKDFAFAKKTIK
ncbi:20210_t:CDS:2, partial [Funneliformis geosporum]